jgi:hypothetical protein
MPLPVLSDFLRDWLAGQIHVPSACWAGMIAVGIGFFGLAWTEARK